MLQIATLYFRNMKEEILEIDNIEASEGVTLLQINDVEETQIIKDQTTVKKFDKKVIIKTNSLTRYQGA